MEMKGGMNLLRAKDFYLTGFNINEPNGNRQYHTYRFSYIEY